MLRKIPIYGLMLVCCVALYIIGCESDGPTGGTVWGINDSLVFEIQIEKTNTDFDGRHEFVDVTMNTEPYRISGFELKFVFDAAALNFQAAIPGELFTDCHWEYFNYQFSLSSLCRGGYLCGMVDLFVVADINLGRPLLSDDNCQMELRDEGPFVLFTFDFIVTDDRTFECAYVPIRFFWEDCDDNVVKFRSHGGFGVEFRTVAKDIYDFDLIGNISNDSTGFPTFTGYQRECHEQSQSQGAQPLQMLELLNGGLDHVCADSIAVRGDINLDGIAMGGVRGK